LSQTINASHFAFLIGIGEDTDGLPLAGDALYKIFAAFLRDVLAQFA